MMLNCCLLFFSMFPEFDKRFHKFKNYAAVTVKGHLPEKPDIFKVYILEQCSDHNVKDGWIWRKGNKSEKINFGNVPGKTKAFKFRCKAEKCQAVKYVDTVISECVSRVYYDGYHNCQSKLSKNGRKQKERDSNSDDDFTTSSVKDKGPIIEANVNVDIPLNADIVDGSNVRIEDGNIVQEMHTNSNRPTSEQISNSRELTVNSVEESSDVDDQSNDDKLDEKLTDIENQNGRLNMLIALKKRKFECLIQEKSKLCDSLDSLKVYGVKLQHEITDLKAMIDREEIKNKQLEETKSVLTSKLELLEESTQLEALTSQVNVLEAFIKDKESYYSLSKCSLDQVQNSLQILSDHKRRKICQVISKEAKIKVKKNLFDEPKRTSINSTDSVNSVSAVMDIGNVDADLSTSQKQLVRINLTSHLLQKIDSPVLRVVVNLRLPLVSKKVFGPNPDPKSSPIWPQKAYKSDSKKSSI